MKKILFFGMFIWIVLLFVSIIIDINAWGDYTDIDYKVVTDGAYYITLGKSPFLRHTYRYPPLLAILMIPNIYISPHFGKILFFLLDGICGLMIYFMISGNKN